MSERRSFERWAFVYWNASYFIRRGRISDKLPAVKILQDVRENAPGEISLRAADTISEALNGRERTEHGPSVA